MRESKNTIDYINIIKEKVELNNYHLKDKLKDDFYKITEYIWEDLDVSNINDLDIQSLCDIHDYLLNEVCRIHSMERDESNEQVFKSNLSLRDLKIELNDGKRAHNIYYFKNEDYEYHFIGDLHSDTISLKRILKTCNFFESIINGGKIRLIFLGDYVDRGKAHLKMVEFILLLKYVFPDNIYLIRGNHDGGRIEEGNMKLCVGRQKNSVDDIYFALYTYNLAKSNTAFKMEIVEKYLKFFDSLCNIAVLSYKNLNVLAVHGGIPRPKTDMEDYYYYLNSISDLTNEKIIDHNKRSVRYNMLWSDPSEDTDEVIINTGRFKFYTDHFNKFMDKLGLDLLVRGHEAEQEGYKKYFDGRLFTLFSSGLILDDNNENTNIETAYENVRPKMLKLSQEEELIIIDLNKND